MRKHTHCKNDSIREGPLCYFTSIVDISFVSKLSASGTHRIFLAKGSYWGTWTALNSPITG